MVGHSDMAFFDWIGPSTLDEGVRHALAHSSAFTVTSNTMHTSGCIQWKLKPHAPLVLCMSTSAAWGDSLTLLGCSP